MCDTQCEFTLADIYLKFTSFNLKSLLTGLIANFQLGNFPDSTGILNACPLRWNNCGPVSQLAKEAWLGILLKYNSVKSKPNGTFLFTSNAGAQGKQASLQADEEEGVDFFKCEFWSEALLTHATSASLLSTPHWHSRGPREAYLRYKWFSASPNVEGAHISKPFVNHSLNDSTCFYFFFSSQKIILYPDPLYSLCNSVFQTWENRSPPSLVLLK